MAGQQYTTSSRPYLTIVGGMIAQPAKEGDVGAKEREYELSDKTKGSKWEIYFLNWEGVLKGISFKTGKYGETCSLELDDAVLQLKVGSKYFKDVACKLFNADLSKPIKFHPFDFEADGKKKTGVSLQQGGKKLTNYFYDGKKNLHGFPEVDEVRKIKANYWKMYFMEVDEFLVEKLKELKFETKSELVKEAESVFEAEVDLDSLPF